MLVFVAVLALTFGACGGSDDSGGGADDGGGDSSSVSAGDAARGEEVFTKTCVSCHGEGGQGIEGLGKPMPGSAFITGLSDDELVEFIKVGRGTGDPDNTTGVDMPAKGGNPSLSEQDLVDVVVYIRTLG
ncbi:MAG: cytochrome c [Acidimicrobiia bacterium]|nr:cytochrome c [Acidimicrobiia bacterium]